MREASRFPDYCANGLQVEGRAQISGILTGVTASAALIQHALTAAADVTLAHHGCCFWRGEHARVVGTRRARLSMLIAHAAADW